MSYIVLGQKLQRHRIAPPNHTEALQFFSRNLREHMKQMAVVARPARHEISPAFFPIILRFHPPLLCVAGKVQRGLQLSANKALMIVRSGINQVPEDLLSRPFAGRDRDCAFRFTDPGKLSRVPFEYGAQSI